MVPEADADVEISSEFVENLEAGRFQFRLDLDKRGEKIEGGLRGVIGLKLPFRTVSLHPIKYIDIQYIPPSDDRKNYQSGLQQSELSHS
jgi:hypothetical protein